MDPKALRSGILLLICIALPLIVGMIGSFFTLDNIPTWYAALNKPAFNPPAWVFGPVWTILYILMGISLYLILRNGVTTPAVRWGVILFAVQIVLNLLWSIIFFGMHSIFFAFVVIIMLLVSLVATIISFYRVSKPAAWLLVPYLCWLGFASVLNGTIWIIN
jgi:translocator protein